MFLAIATILTIIFLIFFVAFINSGEDEHKGWTVFLVLLGIAATIFWFLFGFSWKEKSYMDTNKVIITEAIAKATGEKESDIASLIYLCDGDATIAEMLQIIDKNITEEEAKHFEAIILKQIEKNGE